MDPVIVTLSNSSVDNCSVNEGQTLSLSGSYTDVGTLDTHFALINWGDGSPVQNVGQSGGNIAASHVYADAGFYTVTVTLKDDDGGQDVETTTTVISGITQIGGIVQVIGTNCRDEVEVLKQSSQYIVVKAKLGSNPLLTQTFASTTVDEVHMYLADGSTTAS